MQRPFGNDCQPHFSSSIVDDEALDMDGMVKDRWTFFRSFDETDSAQTGQHFRTESFCEIHLGNSQYRQTQLRDILTYYKTDDHTWLQHCPWGTCGRLDRRDWQRVLTCPMVRHLLQQRTHVVSLASCLANRRTYYAHPRSRPR